MNKAMTEAVTAFTEQTTGVALTAMQTIAKDSSALLQPPFRMGARTAAYQGADLQTALNMAKHKPMVQVLQNRSQTPQRPHTEPPPQFAVVAQRTQLEPSRRQSPASSIVHMDTDEAPAPMVVIIGQGTDYTRAPWAMLLKRSPDKEVRALLAKPRFTTVLSS